MFLKKRCILVFYAKVASALKGLRQLLVKILGNSNYEKMVILFILNTKTVI